VSNLTERKGAGGASDLEQANKMVKQAPRAHKRKTRRATRDMEEDMGFFKIIMTDWLVIYSKRVRLSSDNMD
jgi:hypothetical protein